MSLSKILESVRDPADPAIARHLIRLGSLPTKVSTAGFPYLTREAWEILRDEIPHLFGLGLDVLETANAFEEALGKTAGLDDEKENFTRALAVVRQVTFTAAITAPPDLWLLRHILSDLSHLGLTDRLLEGRAIYPASCRVESSAGGSLTLDAHELEIDLRFLLARGIVERYEASYRIAGHPRVAAVLRDVRELPEGTPISATPVWRRFFSGEALDAAETEALVRLGRQVPRREDRGQTHWVPTSEEIEIGFRLLPVVLALRSTEQTKDLEAGTMITAATWAGTNAEIMAGALDILEAAGWLRRRASGSEVTTLGERAFKRAPGPFGIIETYHPYLAKGIEILTQGSANIWVRRGDNISASQDANHASFVRANDALDRFCADTGFEYTVFIEHAVGKGEASRIRLERSGEEAIQYVGADLEDAAIDGALREQQEGRLPRNMTFVRQADIGKPEALLEALAKAGVDSNGAVMMVGNGFHEARGVTGEAMIEIFAEYEKAGLLLVFTEENALSVGDLRATAWNTYHAGFRYVHERSGQNLRPAYPRTPERGGHLLRRAWHECATSAGYVRADEYSHRSRTIYPYPTLDGHNPAISSTHFCVPGRIARRLGIV